MLESNIALYILNTILFNTQDHSNFVESIVYNRAIVYKRQTFRTVVVRVRIIDQCY